MNLRSITPSVMSLRHRLAGLLPVLMAALLITLSAQLVQAQTYQIRPGDKLRIEVLEDPSLNLSLIHI